MISPFLAARQTALGGGVCQIVSAAAWKGAVPSAMVIEAVVGSRFDLAQMVAPATTRPSAWPKADACSAEAQGSSSHDCSEGLSTNCSSSPSATSSLSQLRQRLSPIAGGSIGQAWRLTPATSSPPWISLPADSLRRCLHTSPPATGAAAVSAVAAAAAAAAEAAEAKRQPTAAASTASTRSPAAAGGRRQQPLSPHAYEFQRRFFQLVNSGTAAAMADGADGAAAAASEAVVHTTNSQAIRMLLAWLEEGRATAAAEYEQQRAAASSSAAEQVPPLPAPGAVAAPYRLDQQIIDRAMEVLWRLYRREGVVTRSRGGSPSPSPSPGGPLELGELLNAAEALCAAAPAMGLVLKRQHLELLVELYGKRALQDPSSRRGLAQRLLAVRQQMVQQLFPLSQPCLNTVLQGVRTDPLLNNATKLSWAIRLVERDLPVVPAGAGAGASSSSASFRGGADRGGITAPLQQTLGFLLRTAAREADWSAYGKLEAALVCRTRSPPPYEVLLDALSAASAAGGPSSRLALGFLAQIEQLEARGPPPPLRQQQQQQQLRMEDGAKQPQQQQQPASSSTQEGAGELQQLQQQQRRRRLDREAQQREYFAAQQARWREEDAERRLEVELRSLRRLVAGGAEVGEEQLARKSYDRLRRLFWRDHPAAASAAAAKDRAEAVAAKGPEEVGAGGGDEDGDTAATATAAVVNPAAAGAVRHTAVLEAAAMCPAPPDATLELLSLSLARRDWPAVLDHVTALAELQSLVERSGGRVGWLLLGNPTRVVGYTSAYGGLRPLSDSLIGSEEDTVAYYTELLRRVAAAAASGAAAPFSGSSVPFGPPLRAAASRADLASVSGIVRQMRELQCGPSADSYAAVVEASLRGGKPERVPGLLELMLEEGLFPTAPVWEVQLRQATSAGDTAGLVAVAERALGLAEAHPQCHEGLARISGRTLIDAATVAEARADGRAASALKLLRLRGEELRNQLGERLRAAQEREARRDRRAAAAAAAAALRRNAVQLQPLAPPSRQQRQQA